MPAYIGIPHRLSLRTLAAGVMGLVVSLDKTDVQVNQLKGQSAGHDQEAWLHRQFRTASERHKTYSSVANSSRYFKSHARS